MWNGCAWLFFPDLCTLVGRLLEGTAIELEEKRKGGGLEHRVPARSVGEMRKHAYVGG